MTIASRKIDKAIEKIKGTSNREEISKNGYFLLQKMYEYRISDLIQKEFHNLLSNPLGNKVKLLALYDKIKEIIEEKTRKDQIKVRKRK